MTQLFFAKLGRGGTFQLGSFLSPGPSASAWYPGSFPLLQVTFPRSHTPSTEKGEAKDGNIKASVPLHNAGVADYVACGAIRASRSCVWWSWTLADRYSISSSPCALPPQLLARTSPSLGLPSLAFLRAAFHLGTTLLGPTQCQGLLEVSVCAARAQWTGQNLLLGKGYFSRAASLCLVPSASLSFWLFFFFTNHAWKESSPSCPVFLDQQPHLISSLSNILCANAALACDTDLIPWFLPAVGKV